MALHEATHRQTVVCTLQGRCSQWAWLVQWVWLVQPHVHDGHAELGEARPRLWLTVPALGHDGVHVGGASLGRDWEELPQRHPLQHLLVAPVLVRQLGKGEDLPTEHAKAPDVAVQGEGGAPIGVQEQLWWHPADREELGAVVIVIRAVEVMADAEVSDLDTMVGGDEAVAGGEVAMDDPLGEEVGHPVGHLQDHSAEDLLGQLRGMGLWRLIGQQILLEVSLDTRWEGNGSNWTLILPPLLPPPSIYPPLPSFPLPLLSLLPSLPPSLPPSPPGPCTRTAHSRVLCRCTGR